MTARVILPPALLVLVSFLGTAVASAQAPKRDITLEKAWYTPVELLTVLAERDGIRWALPQTLAGRALLGETASADVLLDKACQQWGLAWMRANGVVVVHRPNDEKLKKWTAALEKGDPSAAWELGWLRDGRALTPLASALASDNVAVALAAAQAIEVLDTMVPLGRDERVDELPFRRVSLAAAFPPKSDLASLIDSPYPPVRAAALRLLLGHGENAVAHYHTGIALKRTGRMNEAVAHYQEALRIKPNFAEAHYNLSIILKGLGRMDEAVAHQQEALRIKPKFVEADDHSNAVLRVRQQVFGAAPGPKDRGLKSPLPAPKDAEELKGAVAKMVGELPDLAKHSEWEQMRWRVRTLGAWSRAGHQPATDALTELCSTKIQSGWFPAYVHLHLAATGSPEVVAHLKTRFTKADRGTTSRGLEQSMYGNALLAFTRPYLDDQTLVYVTARKAGREAYPDLLAQAARGNYAAIDALGVIGGAEATAALREQMAKNARDSATVIFRSATALGRLGSSEALEALLAATQSDARVRRHAATLALGEIGGPKAAARLRDMLDKDGDRLVRAAAADGLEQIGERKDQALVQAFRKADAGVPESVYQPRNPRFGPDFPVNEWVNLKVRIVTDSPFGEMGWTYDISNRLFARYGGCSGYHNELTVFDLGTEEFVQRRPNEKMAGWGDRRLTNGCTAGRCWDPFNKVVWLGPAIGSTEPSLAIYEYYNKDQAFRFCNYDLATDRFREAPQPRYATSYAFDWKNGLILPVKFTHPVFKTKDFWAFDVKNSAWLDKKSQGDYPRDQDHTTPGIDRDAGLMVLYVAPKPDRPAETWTYDPATNVWKHMQPAVQPKGVACGAFVYDPFHKVLLLQSGKKATQYGGGDDSITWTYDVRTNTWTDMQLKGPGNPWLGAMDFDPEHNVFVLFNFAQKQVWAYRYKPVAPGTKMKG